MELSSTKSNIIYTLFLLISIPLFFLLITSRAWFGNGKNSLSEDYNTIREIGGYYIKVNNAMFIQDKNQLEFTFSVKEISSGSAQGEKPRLISVWLDSEKNALDYTVEGADISRKVLCDSVSEDFKKIIVKIEFKSFDTIIPDKYDEFGDLIPGSVEEGKTIVERITIDKKDIVFMSAEEAATMTTTRAVMTTAAANESSVTLNTVYTSPDETTATVTTSEATSASKNTSRKR